MSRATFAQAVERLDERGIRHSGVKDRGFMDSIYFTDPLGLLVELASYRFEPPRARRTPTCCSPRTGCAWSAADRSIDRVHFADAIEELVLKRARRSATTAGRSDPYQLTEEEHGMADITLNILKPSVNNLTARIFVRAAGLDFEEQDVWGATRPGPSTSRSTRRT